MNFFIFDVKSEKRVKIFDQKIGIFEIAEKQEVEGDSDKNSKIFFAIFDPQSKKIISSNRKQKQR